jgi:hypothetical protein
MEFSPTLDVMLYKKSTDYVICLISIIAEIK